MSSAPRVLLIVAGGIAAYKAPQIVRSLRAFGADVRVVTTSAAQAFVTELALSSVSGYPVRSQMLDASAEGSIGHIELADWPDLIVVAPATADLMARAAHGRANDLASCILLATRAPILWAPAMNTNMWMHPATRQNAATLQAWGAEFVGPGSGELACGWVGEGRMVDPPIIAAAVQRVLACASGSLLAGRRILVSAGPTRTYLDPVRFLSNASTGVMGFALAEAAAHLGASVTLVAGPVALPTPFGVTRVDVGTATEMLAAMGEVLATEQTDLVAMVAAVGDLDVDAPSPQKHTKDAFVAAMGRVTWKKAPDVVATLAAKHRPATRFLAFAAQTVAEDCPDIEAELVALGQAKMARKQVDALFVNRVGVAGTGFASSTNAGHLLVAGEKMQVHSSGPPQAKQSLAAWMLRTLAPHLWQPEVPA